MQLALQDRAVHKAPLDLRALEAIPVPLALLVLQVPWAHKVQQGPLACLAPLGREVQATRGSLAGT